METDEASFVQPFNLLSLDTQTSTVSSSVGACRTINSLPMEVLHRILSFACDDEYKVDITPGARPFQHILIRVCRLWYSTVHSHYGSISQLSVTYLDSVWYRSNRGYSSDSTISSRHLQFLRTALKLCRSRFHCNIYVKGSGGADIPEVPQGVVHILAELVSTSDRWLSLDVDMDIPLQFLLPIHNNIPHLQSLVLTHRHNTGESREAFSLLFNNAPSLTHVKAEVQAVDYQFPWDQLQELTLSPQWNGFGPDGFEIVTYVTTAVLSSTRLRHFTCISPDSPHADAAFPPVTIPHPTLREFCAVQPDVFLLQHLKLPALDTILFHFQEHTYDLVSFTNRFIQGFLEFLKRSHCGSNIHSFSLTHADPASVMPRIHPVLPNLKHLQVRVFSFNPVFDFLDLLCSTNLFPYLEELDLSLEMDAARITDSAINTMLTMLVTVVSKQSHPNLKHVILSIDGQKRRTRISTLLDFAAFKSQSPVLVSLKELETPMFDVHATYWVENDVLESYELLTSKSDGRGHWPKRVSFTNDEGSVILYRFDSKLPPDERN